MSPILLPKTLLLSFKPAMTPLGFVLPLSFPMKTNPTALSLNQLGGHARQGDTLLRRVSTIPALKIAKPTLAYGEKTGHHHTFSEGGAVGFADDEKALADFVRVEEPQAPLTHQEHSTITYPKGDYESLRQVEDTSEEVRPVAD